MLRDLIYSEDHISVSVSFLWSGVGVLKSNRGMRCFVRIVSWQRKVLLASNLNLHEHFNFGSASLYGVPGRMIRKALFWTISIFFDRYCGRPFCDK